MHTRLGIPTIRKRVPGFESKRSSADFIDLKVYEPGMRYLIDNYIEANNAQKLGVFDDFTLADVI